MDATNPGVNHHSSPDSDGNNELCEHVNQESPADLAGLYYFWSLWIIALDECFNQRGM